MRTQSTWLCLCLYVCVFIYICVFASVCVCACVYMYLCCSLFIDYSCVYVYIFVFVFILLRLSPVLGMVRTAVCVSFRVELASMSWPPLTWKESKVCACVGGGTSGGFVVAYVCFLSTSKVCGP